MSGIMNPAAMALRGPLAETLAKGVSHQFVWPSNQSIADSEEILPDTSSPCIVRMLEAYFTGEGSDAMILMFRPRDEQGNSATTRQVRILGENNGGESLRPSRLREVGGESSYWKMTVDDENEHKYGFFLKQPILFPGGTRLAVANMSTGRNAYLALIVDYLATTE